MLIKQGFCPFSSASKQKKSSETTFPNSISTSINLVYINPCAKREQANRSQLH